MRRNGALIRGIQWIVVLVYAVLILVPIFLPLPDETAHIWSNLTLIAQFCFWGIWWPFVLVSMVLMGRVWCGVLCPEGALTEFASKFGRNWAIPRWMRWGGWPFVAFALTTIYGQMVSVYQYPKAVLLVLGGSTLGAMIVGYLYGREKRVWCKYLCPVNGVFGLLAKLAPFHYKVNEDAWRASYDTHGKKTIAINCAPLVPLRNMKGASDCHMCGRCSGHRDAIALTWRAPTVEIVKVGRTSNNLWESSLVLYGLFGIAIGAFHWSASPWFVEAKQFIATWLIDRDIMWPFATNAPWWLLTNYPQQSDVFSWLDGGLVVSYILATAAVLGTALTALFALSNMVLGPWSRSRFNHLVQSAIPLAGCGVFVGLSATTISLLRAEHWPVDWANDVRAALLTVMTLWSVLLAWKVIGQHAEALPRRVLAMLPVIGALALVNYAWLLMFWIW
ncbi:MULTISPECIES: 4Fe-4S binding protein [unclassified Herbaspirillum]|uniref:4Fe-4S binding protein n=1 Tax=unclassified Herbaspirillum TaxID=2624150 RepID=UPI000E2F18D0|nr:MULTISPECIES: 4Fe-4S binding protein [unclassified Herbaspirillum]RFB74219.1 4Fe-4S binding protein [Herbaspirillum sp. 3R-3a1]TFI11567.1 4Fe-4S binding protein [Herbaspirillum sp. 3R11]TFI17470.1 4Fe-4S binding protein [Herbaspirillum sp. 3R-11]TFI23464.1 4Fe-4S binding protein [Herbaspirillum sp. 3C11]